MVNDMKLRYVLLITVLLLPISLISAPGAKSIVLKVNYQEFAWTDTNIEDRIIQYFSRQKDITVERSSKFNSPSPLELNDIR